MDIRLYKYQPDGSCRWMGVCDDYMSLSYTRSWSDIGEWELMLKTLSPNTAAVLQADFIHFGAGRAGIICRDTLALSNDGDVITVAGLQLKALATARIVYPPSGQEFLKLASATHDRVMAELITTQIIAPVKSERRIAGTLLPYTTAGDAEKYQGRFENVGDTIIEHAIAGNVGWDADIANNQIVWRISHGTDRSTASNNQIILSADRNSFDELEVERSSRLPNHAIVAGRGRGASRKLAEVGGKSGLARIEVYVEARDKEEQADLPATGTKALAEFGDALTISGPLSEVMRSRYLYGSDYDLGDVVTVQGVIAEDIDIRITAITEVHDEDGATLDVEFGYARQTLTDSLRRSLSGINPLLRTEID